MILKEGIHLNVSAIDYHADPCPEPSLSSSLAKILINKSPKHAWLAHPRLNPDFQHEIPDRKMLLGSAAHESLLGRGAGVMILEEGDFKTKATREMRDDALAKGIIPILRSDNITVEKMADAARMKLKRCGLEKTFEGGHKECVIIQKGSGPVQDFWFRSMLDVWNENEWTIIDYKTTGSLDGIDRLISSGGYDVQAAFYSGMVPEIGARAQFLWLFQEREPPYDCIVAEPSYEMLAIGEKKVARAREIWSTCLAYDKWPGYSDMVMTVDLPKWAAWGWTDGE